MQISIETIISVVIGSGALIGIYVKMQVDNALHKEKTASLKANIDKLEVRLSDHEDKMEVKIDKLINSVNEIKTSLGKISK